MGSMLNGKNLLPFGANSFFFSFFFIVDPFQKGFGVQETKHLHLHGNGTLSSLTVMCRGDQGKKRIY